MHSPLMSKEIGSEEVEITQTGKLKLVESIFGVLAVVEPHDLSVPLDDLPIGKWHAIHN
jgi:hypothetical protein